ncbi:MAG: hypothetical protein H6975_02785 [Gammaproteobacteria bacterium]|nr:hypothetical protein [Gammaproteobacteria bacterium]
MSGTESITWEIHTTLSIVIFIIGFSIIGPGYCRGGQALEGKELVSAWLNSVAQVSLKTFTPIESFQDLPAKVKGNSSLWSERFFSNLANPQKQQDKVQHGIHVATESTPDLILYQYRVKDLELTVVESINFTLVFVGGMALFNMLERSRAEAIDQAAQMILNLKDDEHEWVFQFPEKLEDNAMFSTNPETDPFAMYSWTHRADGGIHRRVLYFLLFKKLPDKVGYQNTQTWFDPDFRAKWRRP